MSHDVWTLSANEHEAYLSEETAKGSLHWASGFSLGEVHVSYRVRPCCYLVWGGPEPIFEEDGPALFFFSLPDLDSPSAQTLPPPQKKGQHRRCLY